MVKMRKLIGLLAISAFFVFPLCVNAGIIGNANLIEGYTWPAGEVTFNGGTNWGDYYINYSASLNGGVFLPAFCVENVPAPVTIIPYTLLTIDAGLNNFGLNSLNYRAAAWVAQQYYATQKGAAQIAIWEIIYDGVNNFHLTTGNFQSRASGYGDWNAAALAIWNTIPINSLPAVSSQWVLAVNPAFAVGRTIADAPTQNYNVDSPVPIPGAAWLLGSGLLGLAGVRRKFKK